MKDKCIYCNVSDEHRHGYRPSDFEAIGHEGLCMNIVKLPKTYWLEIGRHLTTEIRYCPWCGRELKSEGV